MSDVVHVPLCEEAAEGAQSGKILNFDFFIGYILILCLKMQTWEKTLFFCICYFFIFISLQASEISLLDSIAVLSIKLSILHNINHEGVINKYVPSKAI
jgi:hypothetical protein